MCSYESHTGINEKEDKPCYERNRKQYGSFVWPDLINNRNQIKRSKFIRVSKKRIMRTRIEIYLKNCTNILTEGFKNYGYHIY